MKNVEFISAGAGSGKTHRLIEKIKGFLKDKTCRADQIILTTFTRMAAAELKEKTKATLYKEGMYDEATNIDSAAIGTIHSVSYELLSKFWYFLGLSPELRLIADETRDFYVNQSLATLPSQEQLNFFSKVRNIFNIQTVDNFQKNGKPDYLYWKRDLEKIIDKINNFCLDDKDLRKSATESVELLKEVMNVNSKSTLPSVKEIETNLLKIKKLIPERENMPQTDIKRLSFLNSYLNLIRGNEKNLFDHLTEIINLSNKIAGKDFSINLFLNNVPEEISFFKDLGDKLLQTDSIFQIIKEYIETIVELSINWKQKYEAFKKERRLLDFNDIEMYFFELLQHTEIVEELQSRYKVALVDEFQDSSPQQVRFFTRLSEILEKSVWVGDIKQAIYNFRGTDVSVVYTVMKQASEGKDGNSISTLERCWRSNSTIVDLVNNVFIPTFYPMPQSLIELKMPDRDAKYDRPEEQDLQHWHFNVGRKEEIYIALANKLKELRTKNEIPEYKDIAILCRTGREIDNYATAFGKIGIPFRIKKTDNTKDDKGNTVLNFLEAVVSYASYGGNDLSKSLLAYWSEKGYTASRIISDRLAFLQDDEKKDITWLENLDLIRRIDKMRNTVNNQSVAMAVDTLINQLNLTDQIKKIDQLVDAYQVCRDYVNRAKEYEEICIELGLGASLPGFLEYVKSKQLSPTGDNNGILITTYHGSKGLEWKCVILAELNYEVISIKKVISGINIYREEDNLHMVFIPDFIVSIFTPSINDRISYSKPFKCLEKDTIKEAKRLLYVGMTRPKEYLITITAKTRKDTYGTDWPDLVTEASMIAIDRREESIIWFTKEFRYSNITFTFDLEEDDKEIWQVEMLKGAEEIRNYEIRNVTPSTEKPLRNIDGAEIIGNFADRLSSKSDKSDDATLGSCIHHLLCLYNSKQGNKEMIKDICKEFGVILDSDKFIQNAGNFYGWLQENYGMAQEILKEVPFRFINAKGQEVKGEIDLIYRTEKGDVLIDYKTFSGKLTEITEKDSKFFAGKYSGQLSIYEEAIRKAGYKLRDSLICYFNLGKIVRLKFLS